MDYDVVIIGGGPSGSTLAGFLGKYAPGMRVLVLEREKFPRDHVGESQLPPITRILAELGCWDQVEAAGFPVKIGALYRWGKSDDHWRFDFLAGRPYKDGPRPMPLKGQRWETTFQVDRAVYDDILLRHAARLGAEVWQETKVAEVLREGDRVTGLRLGDGRVVTGATYIDATGHTGLLRRAMGVEVDEPTLLKNIAIWDYWRSDKWADTVAKGGTRVRVMSLGYGWIWFIPLAPDRVSVGLVTSAEYYKQSKTPPRDLYARAISEEPHIRELMEGAESEGKLASTKDWSFVAERLVGENWFLVGESAGFADPILAAGMTLAQVGARELAHILIALHREEHDRAWLTGWYDEIQRKRIGQHIRFADYWYSANSHFTDLKAYTSEIAREAGFDLEPDKAFQWLGTGGFASDDLTSPVVGTYQLGSAKFAMQVMTAIPATWAINGVNEFRLNLEGAETIEVPMCREGRIEKVRCYRRGAKLLPLAGMYRAVVGALQRERDAAKLVASLRATFAQGGYGAPNEALGAAFDALEGMLAEGWITGKLNRNRPCLNVLMDESTIQVSPA